MVISVYISIESFRYLYLVTPISYYNNKKFSKTKKMNQNKREIENQVSKASENIT